MSKYGSRRVERRSDGRRRLTVFRDLQDVAYERAVAVKRLGPGQVHGSFFQFAQHGGGVLRSMGELPAGGITGQH